MKSTKRRMASLMIAGAFLTGLPALAATWRVEKDGSGDFTVIQQAVDAAASGDTILIGPGRFEEYSDYEAGNGTIWQVWILVLEKPGLTILGTGDDQTFVGLSPGVDPGPYSVGAFAYPHADITIRGLGFEVFRFGVTTRGGALTISDCAFRGHGLGTRGVFPSAAGTVRISGCEFDGWGVGVGALSPGCSELVTENCRFANCWEGVDVQYSVNPNTRVVGNEFVNCSIMAIGVIFGAGGEIVDNVIRGDTRIGIDVEGSRDVQIVGNDVEISCDLSQEQTPWGVALFLTPSTGYDVIVTGNVLRSNQVCVYAPYHREQVSFHGNHILPLLGGCAVRCFYPWDPPLDYPEVRHWDFSQNYWGTTDVGRIAASIVDWNDDHAYEIVVDYLPLAEGPIVTERATWSDVKALWE